MFDIKSQDNYQEITDFRQQHIGRLLLLAHRAFSINAVEKLQQYGHIGLSLAHTNLLANLDPAGTRITVLAERAGVTKQAISSLVLELEQKGYITRATDATDRRAIIINFTATGWQFLLDANKIKHEIETEYTATLGEEGMKTLNLLLTELIESQTVTKTPE